MSFEDRLAQSLRETGEEFTPRNLTGLVNSGVADGRRRRRRRSAAVLGGSAALALIAVGGALVPSALGGAANHETAGVAAQPGMSLAGSSKPVSDGERAAELLKALQGVLPAGGGTSQERASWTSKAPGGKNVVETASLVYDDGKGAAGIAVSLTKYPANVRDLPSCAPNSALAPNDVCHTYQTPGGGRLIVDLGYEYPAKGTGTKSWSAWLELPDGSQLEFTELNAAQEKDSPVTRQAPPLSADQLHNVALSDVWTRLLAQVPAPSGHPLGAPSSKPFAHVTPSAGAH
jgi:hypothetical protein